NDRTINLDKHQYEGPVSLIGKQVDLLYHANEYDRVELQYRNQSYGFLKEVDPHVNYSVKRYKNNDSVILSDNTKPLSGQMWEGGS
ncbi:MAG: IS481 family transposase, partial [Deltaproteobacteria bacterium]|nr:IS481 family transposase [Deltaproteobacteria bacterium]